MKGDCYILLKGKITIIGQNVTQVAFENCVPLTTLLQKLVEQQQLMGKIQILHVDDEIIQNEKRI